jgi:lactate racemase
MSAEVAFGDERLTFDIPAGRFHESWEVLAGGDDDAIGPLVEAALESPIDFPPLRQAVVPGDRVVIALDSDIPAVASVLAPLIRVLHAAGVEEESIRIAVTRESTALSAKVFDPVKVSIHNPDDRDQIAYLATTGSGRRVYLNRYLTDADFVLPVGTLGFAGHSRYRGPWTALFPSMSDSDTLRSTANGTIVDESEEVSWLLGSQFQLGILAGSSGVLRVVAGQQESVRREGVRAIDELWKFQPSRSAELVIVGVGGPGRPGGVDDVAAGLANARRVVARGGKIVVLSRASGSIGPALQAISPLDDPRIAVQRLRGLEGEADYAAAKQIAEAVAWADVYLLSNLGDDVAEDLAMVTLGRPEEARRLVATAESSLLISGADRARVEPPLIGE